MRTAREGGRALSGNVSCGSCPGLVPWGRLRGVRAGVNRDALGTSARGRVLEGCEEGREPGRGGVELQHGCMQASACPVGRSDPLGLPGLCPPPSAGHWKWLWGVCGGGVALGEEAVLSGWLRLFPKREVSPAPRIPGEGRLGVAGGPNEGI